MKPEIHPRGYWLGDTVSNFDPGLADALVTLFRGQTVIDWGCGHGDYVARLRQAGIRAWGIDGNPMTPTWCDYAQVGDLSVPQRREYWPTWSLCIEVAEHVPAEFEAVLLDNILQAKTGIVLSWAQPGQGGHGHFNERAPEYVDGVMAARGWMPDEPAGKTLREASELPWLRNNVRVWRRNGQRG